MFCVARSVKRFSRWSSGAPAAQLSCLAIGVEMRASSSLRSASWNPAKPAKPSFCTIRATVGVDTPAASASRVIETRPETG